MQDLHRHDVEPLLQPAPIMVPIHTRPLPAPRPQLAKQPLSILVQGWPAEGLVPVHSRRLAPPAVQAMQRPAEPAAAEEQQACEYLVPVQSRRAQFVPRRLSGRVHPAAAWEADQPRAVQPEATVAVLADSQPGQVHVTPADSLQPAARQQPTTALASVRPRRQQSLSLRVHPAPPTTAVSASASSPQPPAVRSREQPAALEPQKPPPPKIKIHLTARARASMAARRPARVVPLAAPQVSSLLHKAWACLDKRVSRHSSCLCMQGLAQLSPAPSAAVLSAEPVPEHVNERVMFSIPEAAEEHELSAELQPSSQQAGEPETHEDDLDHIWAAMSHQVLASVRRSSLCDVCPHVPSNVHGLL